MTVFDEILDGDDVEVALLAHLKAWMPTLVAEVRRQKDPESKIWPDGIAAIRSYTVVHAVEEKWPEDQLPMLLAYSPGLAAPPVAEGDGAISAKYQVQLSAIASGSTPYFTKRLARVYASAARAAILQNESLGGFATGVEWIEEHNFPVTTGAERERNLMAVSAMYVIEVPQVLNRDAGIREPLEDPDEIAVNPPIKTARVLAGLLDDEGNYVGPEFE